MAAPPQYPQLLRALAMQRLGAGDTGQGARTDWRMISHSAHAEHMQNAGNGQPMQAAPPGVPPALLEQIRQRLARKAAITGRPPAQAAGQLGTQYRAASAPQVGG